MKQIPPALAALPAETREEALELLRQWKMHTWVCTAITASAVTVLFLLMYRSMEEYGIFSTLAAVLLPVSLVYVIVLAVLERVFRRKLAQIPDLQQTVDANLSYLAASQTTPQHNPVRVMLIVLLCILCFPVGLAAAVIYDRKQRERAVVYVTPASALRAQAEKHAKTLGCSGFLLFGIAAACMVFEGMMGSVATSKLSALNQNAHSICSAANYALTDMDNEGQLPELSAGTYIIRSGDTYEEGSLEARIAKYYYTDLSRSGYWYALQFDGDGKAVAAWASKHPLTEAELVPTDYFEQRRLLKTFTHQDEAVGYYDGLTQKTET